MLNPIRASNEFKFHAFMKLGKNMNGRKLFFALAATSGENENFPFSRGAPSAVRFSHSAGWLSKGALGILFDGKAQSLQTGLPIEVFFEIFIVVQINFTNGNPARNRNVSHIICEY